MDEIVSTLEESSEELFDAIGAGHSESTYHTGLERELSSRGIPFSSECTIPIIYKGTSIGRCRPDMFIETDDGIVVVELKATSSGGADQLSGYLSILEKDDNFEIAGGVLIRFNETVEVIKG